MRPSIFLIQDRRGGLEALIEKDDVPIGGSSQVHKS